MHPVTVDPGLYEFCTDKQREVLDAIERCGSGRQAEQALGKSNGVASATLKAVKKKAARQGYSPNEDERGIAPDGFEVIGKSRYDPETRQWTKTRRAREDIEARDAAFEALAASLPRAKAIKPPTVVQDALCNLYTLTDCHVGMLAWHREGGDDWDLPISEEVLTGCFELMVRQSPKAKVGIVNQLGDFLHYDGLLSITPQNRHVLDADGRFTKMAEYAVRILRRVIDCTLKHHEQVHVILAEGNHDEASSVWLRVMFKALYENEPRVTVDDSALPFYVYQHGATMLAFHHGHKVTKGKMQGLFAAQFPKIWGATEHRYAHCGHMHHKDEKEDAGMEIYQHPTLAARDAYAARGGWIAGRKATAITYHDKYGEAGRVTIGPEMLR